MVLPLMQENDTYDLHTDRQRSMKPKFERRHAPKRDYETLQDKGLSEVIDEGLRGYVHFAWMDFMDIV